MKQEYDTTFLARWMANELSEEELKAFKESEEYAQYTQILEEVDHAKFPDFNVEKHFEGTLAKISSQPTKTKKVRGLLYWAGIAAASLILYFGFTLFLKQTTHTTEYAQQTELSLPDGSQVQLNAASKLQYKSFRWKQHRDVHLEGEAFFKVKKGETFNVNTSQGKVTVLGTQFVVNVRPDYFKVVCHEGKVAVKIRDNDAIILTQGKALNFQKGALDQYDTQLKEPEWLTGESSFNNVSIFEVINELERQYNITIKGKEHLKPANFSGRFSHNDLDLAVKTIFVSMDIPYTFTNNKDVVIKK